MCSRMRCPQPNRRAGSQCSLPPFVLRTGIPVAVRRNPGLPRPQQPRSGDRDDAATLVEAFLAGLASDLHPKVIDVIMRAVAESAASITAKSQNLSSGGEGMAHGLLEKAWEAHGGLDRWKSFDMVHATIVSGGQLW